MDLKIATCTPSFVLMDCPHSNLWPEVVYYCITVTQELQCLQCCLHVDIIGIYQFTKFCSSAPSSLTRYLNVLPEGVYCSFIRTTLYTTMFAMIIFVCLLKSVQGWLLYQ